MVDAACSKVIGFESVECSVFRKTDACSFKRVLQQSRFCENGVDFVVLVHVEVACDKHRCSLGNLTNLCYYKFGSFATCHNTHMVHMKVEEIEHLLRLLLPSVEEPMTLFFLSLHSELAPSADTNADCIPAQAGLVRRLAEPEITVVKKLELVCFVKDSLVFATMLAIVIKSGFSRIPVYDETLDKVEGILYVKDLLPYLDAESYEWQKLIRPAFYVPENRKINDLFQDFREKKIHIAIVVDEYGGTSGLITMEDVIEEIVGEINDEFDETNIEDHYRKLDDGSYLFKAQTSIVDFCKVFGVDEGYFEPMQGEADTLAGLILEIEGRIPEIGFKFNFEKFHMEITDADTKRIKEVKVVFDEE